MRKRFYIHSACSRTPSIKPRRAHLGPFSRLQPAEVTESCSHFWRALERNSATPDTHNAHLP